MAVASGGAQDSFSLEFRADAVRAAPETAGVDAPLHVEEPAVARAPEELAPGHVEAVRLRLVDVRAPIPAAGARERGEALGGPGREGQGRGVAAAVGPGVGLAVGAGVGLAVGAGVGLGARLLKQNC